MSSRQILTYKISGGGNNVLKTDATSADAYLNKTWASGHNEVWVTFQMAVTADTVTNWGNDNGSGNLATVYNNGGTQITETLYSDVSGDWHFNGHTTGATASGPVPSDTWIQIEMHTTAPGDDGELYIDTVLACSYNGSNSAASQELNFGQLDAIIGGTNIVYYKDLLVGTTRGGSDVFSEDFSSDFSNWDSVTGDCTIVSDPY